MTLVVTADSFAMPGISVNPGSSPGAVASFAWYPADSVSFLRKLNRTANLAHVCAFGNLLRRMRADMAVSGGNILFQCGTKHRSILPLGIPPIFVQRVLSGGDGADQLLGTRDSEEGDIAQSLEHYWSTCREHSTRHV